MTWKHYSLEQAAGRFDSSEDFTIGIEEEFQILDPDSLQLVDRFEALHKAAHGRIGTFARGELIASEIEVCTDKCDNLSQAEADLKSRRQGLYEAADEIGVTLGAAGTHPFADWKDQRIVDTPHYRDVEERLRYCAWRNVTFGMHIHVGVKGHERVIAVFNAMRSYLPHLLALSANSPFSDGRYTYLHSARTQIFTRFFPRCNIPAPLRNWDEYATLVDTLFATDSISKPTQIWWSIRPHPVFGTLEIRICDSQSNIDDTLAIAALAAALIARLAADYDDSKPLKILNPNYLEENFWRAIRFGLDGSFVDFDSKKEIPAGEAIMSLIEYTAGMHAALGLEKYISRINTILSEGNGAQQQIRLYEETGDIAAVHARVVDWSRSSLSYSGDT